MKQILLVEDDDSLRDVLASILEQAGYGVVPCADVQSALKALPSSLFSLVLSDFRLPDQSGLDLLQVVRRTHPNLPFLLMTAFGSIDIAVEAMKLGANDFICKPFEPSLICGTIQQLIEHRQIVDRTLGLRTRRNHSFLSQDAVMQRVLEQAKKVARVDSSVLLLGESGVGKELIARFIHDQSPRKDRPFIAINCAALPADLLESEFFGHEAGAFTGATQDRVGVFETAAEGTLFLDEVGDMPVALQVKLLRALQEGEIKRLGSTKTKRASPRIIAATNHDIEDAISDGRIREDFYYRISVVSLTIPPLRERPADIDVLVPYFAQFFANASGRQPPKISDAAWDLLRRYPWPGNGRELENVMERAVILAGDSIEPEHCGIQLGIDFESLDETKLTLPEIAARAAAQAERELIQKAMRRTRGNKTRAARMLGVSYKTLLNKVKEYNLGPLEEVEGSPPPLQES